VAKGDLLAEIDSRPYVHALGQAEGQLARDQALLKNAELDLARYRKLVAQDSIPRQQLDTQDSLVHQYVGTVETDQALVDNARLNVAYCHITAPISGRVGLRQVDQGNYVQTNDTNGIVVITQIQPITVIFTVAEDELPAIMTRLHAGAVLPVTAYDRSRSAELATGRLTTVDNQIDTSTGTVKLRAEFDNADLKLFPNQFVTVRLTVDELHDATTIASAAVQRGAAGTFVYLIKPDDTVTVRPVTLGPSEGERAAVQSGLAPGDQVVVDGADKLRDGAKVARRDATGAAAPAAGAAPSAAKKGRGAKP
jgi:membrane fusion protein, multidrug efflux system